MLTFSIILADYLAHNLNSNSGIDPDQEHEFEPVSLGKNLYNTNVSVFE